MNVRRVMVAVVVVAALALAGVATAGVVAVLTAGSAAEVAGDGAGPATAPNAVAPSTEASLSPSAGAVGIASLVDATWIAAVAERAGIPPRALAAYAGAALATARADPDCGLGWNTLAAIGYVESGHGTIGGSRLDADGVARPGIVGIALDGATTARITDTDGGQLDGDEVWDRAVGPMQFIPETWAAYGRDGDADGSIDVQQIDDAALSAAAYLCDVGGDLTRSENWIAAVHAYNADVDYNHRVADAAQYYAPLG